MTNHFIFSSSTRIHAPPGGKSTISLQHNDMAPPVAQRRPADLDDSRYDDQYFGKRTSALSSNIFANGASQNNGNMITERCQLCLIAAHSISVDSPLHVRSDPAPEFTLLPEVFQQFRYDRTIHPWRSCNLVVKGVPSTKVNAKSRPLRA